MSIPTPICPVELRRVSYFRNIQTMFDGDDDPTLTLLPREIQAGTAYMPVRLGSEG
jgi:hypothetical protein